MEVSVRLHCDKNGQIFYNMKQTKLQKQIADTNTAFKKASKAQKRVMIAQDVIAQIKAKRYIAESGTFVIANWDGKIKFDDHSDSIQEAFQKSRLKLVKFALLVASS
jgi:hypothetical protein